MLKTIKHLSLVTASILAVSTVGFALPGCASQPKQESAGQYIDSSAITVRVQSALLADPKVKSLPIKVKTYKGVVQLSGFVDNYQDKRRAVRIARNVPGVVDIQDSLVVK